MAFIEEGRSHIKHFSLISSGLPMHDRPQFKKNIKKEQTDCFGLSLEESDAALKSRMINQQQ